MDTFLVTLGAITAISLLGYTTFNFWSRFRRFSKSAVSLPRAFVANMRNLFQNASKEELEPILDEGKDVSHELSMFAKRYQQPGRIITILENSPLNMPYRRAYVNDLVALSNDIVEAAKLFDMAVKQISESIEPGKYKGTQWEDVYQVKAHVETEKQQQQQQAQQTQQQTYQSPRPPYNNRGGFSYYQSFINEIHPNGSYNFWLMNAATGIANLRSGIRGSQVISFLQTLEQQGSYLVKASDSSLKDGDFYYASATAYAS